MYILKYEKSETKEVFILWGKKYYTFTKKNSYTLFIVMKIEKM